MMLRQREVPRLGPKNQSRGRKIVPAGSLAWQAGADFAG